MLEQAPVLTGLQDHRGIAMAGLTEMKGYRRETPLRLETTDMALFVRTSSEAMDGWDRSRIVDALLRETFIDEGTAEDISLEVEHEVRRIAEYRVDRVGEMLRPDAWKMGSLAAAQVFALVAIALGILGLVLNHRKRNTIPVEQPPAE